MLREIARTNQVAGEPRRRWFASPHCDLIVWMDDREAPVAFQFCYDKSSGEHALGWREDEGFSHTAVDAGESRPGRHKGAPILVADGVIDAPRILGLFEREAASLPADIAGFVAGKLRGLGDRSA